MMNISHGSTLSLDGLAHLYEHRFMFLLLFLLLYVFVMLSDSLVVYIICSQRSLHRPMYVFVVAVLVNSAVASSVIYPKLIWDLLQGRRVVLLPLSLCLYQAFMIGSLGCSSFLLLLAMAFDRYLCICRPLHYAALMSPTAVATLLLVCWLWPALIMVGVVTLASRLQPCLYRVTRLYCDMYTIISLSCGRERLLSEVYGLLSATLNIFLPIVLILFSYGRILVLCLLRSRKFASKAFQTCLPHVIVFLNFSGCTVSEVLYRRVPSGGTPSTVVSSVLMVIIPTVSNPVVYGLKVGEIYQKLKELLHRHRWPKKMSPESTQDM